MPLADYFAGMDLDLLDWPLRVRVMKPNKPYSVGYVMRNKPDFA